MQHRGNVLIGLRTDADHNSLIESDSDVFDSDGLNDGVLKIQSVTPAPIKIEATPGYIKNFSEISPYLSPIVANLENYSIPTVFTTEVSFIPKNIVPDDLSRALLDFSKDMHGEKADQLYQFIITYNSNNFPNMILAQIELIKYVKTGEKEGLYRYMDKKLDSRILSLLHFALINQSSESNIERQADLYHEVISLQEYIKFPTPAPLASLFPQFTVPDIIYRLCLDLINEFPSNPFLESVITIFQPYCPKVESLLSVINAENDEDIHLFRSNYSGTKDERSSNGDSEIDETKKTKKKRRSKTNKPKSNENSNEKNESSNENDTKTDKTENDQKNQNETEKEKNDKTDNDKTETDQKNQNETEKEKNDKANNDKTETDFYEENDDDEYDFEDDSNNQALQINDNNNRNDNKSANLDKNLDIYAEDSDSLSDDSFFIHLKEAQQQGTTALINLHETQKCENPLDLENKPGNRFENIILREPPQMVTFLFSDNSHQMTPATFENWIFSIRCDRPEAIKSSSIIQHQPALGDFDEKRKNNKSTLKPPYKSSPIASSLNQSDEGSTFEESVDYYFSLLSNLDDQFIIQKLPSSIMPPFYSLYLPIVHTFYMNDENIKINSILYPKMLAYEKDAHMGLRLDDRMRAQRTLSFFKERVESFKFDFNLVEPHRLEFEKRRKQPPLTPDIPDTFVAVMSVIDYELIVHSRSPLSFEYYTVQVENIDNKSLICDPHWRSCFLFWQYTTNCFSPYMCFRIAFALAVNLADKNPDLSCSFAFEALYVFLSNVPFVRKLPCIRSVLLFFGEFLEKLNRYYYAAHVLDNFFLSDIRNASYSSKIAQIASKNNDVVRAIFHYNQTLKSFVAHGYIDEALYIGQVIASIYIEHSYLSSAISLLTYLLYLSYDIPVGKKREKVDAVALGSLRISRPRPKLSSSISEFKPCRRNLSTIISATMLSRLLAKMNYFKQANDLIEKVIDSSNTSMKKLLLFTQSFIYYQQNDLSKMLETAPSFELPKYIANAGIRNFISTLLTKHTSHESSIYLSPHSSTNQLQTSRSRSKTTPKINASINNSYFGLRSNLSSHFSMLSATNFDSNTATIHLLSRAFLERDQFRQAFLYSELFIHCCSSQNTKELGCGFFYRGMALLMAAYKCQYQVDLFEISNKDKSFYPNSPTNSASTSTLNLQANENSKEKMKELKERIEKEKKEKKIKEKERDPKILQHDKLRYPQLPFELIYDSSKCYTKEELIELAFISFSAARSCFTKVSSSNKLARASIMMLDLLVYNPDTLKNSMIETNEEDESDDQNSKNEKKKKKTKKTKSFSDDEDNQNQKKEDDDVIDLNSKRTKMKVKPPVLLTHFPNFDPPSFDSIIDSSISFVTNNDDTDSQCIEKVDELMNKTESLTTRILDPLYIIHLEILSAAHNLAKGMKQEAQTKFDYAFNNFQKLFICGYHLIPIDLKIKKLRYIKFILEKMCITLTEFDSSFINDRLLVFDIYNDVCVVLKNRLRNEEPRNLQPLEPSVELSSMILELENPKFPSFAPILQSNGIIDENSHLFSENLRISECLDSISANIKLCNKEKITIEEMRNRNRKLCMSISTIAETTRRQNSSQLPPDTSYSFLQRCKPEAAGAILIQRLFNHIFIYVPFTGYIHRVDYPYPTINNSSTTVSGENEGENISISKSSSFGNNCVIYGGGNGYNYNGSCMESNDDGEAVVNVNIEGKSSYEFNCDLRNCLFSGKFIEFCVSLLLYNDNKKVRKAMTINPSLLSSAAKSLFGKDLLKKIESLSSSSQQVAASALATASSVSSISTSSTKSFHHSSSSPSKLLKQRDFKSPKKDKENLIDSENQDSTENATATATNNNNNNETEKIAAIPTTANIFHRNPFSSMKLIFIASHDMQFIPFEIFFPNYNTIRCPFLMQMMLMTTSNTSQTSITRSIFLRYKPSSCFPSSSSTNNSNSDHDFDDDYSSTSDTNKFAVNNLDCIYELGSQRVYGYEYDEQPILSQSTQALQRTRELLNELFTSFGSGDFVINFVDGFERLTGFPTPLFLSFKDADFKKYLFCDFVDLLPNEFPRTQNASSSLFIFTYTDLCEMPALVRRVLSDYPFSFFLFIPVAMMKDALKVMKKKFCFSKKKFGIDNSNDESNTIIKEKPMSFVLALQVDLQRNLKVPIPLISYLH